ncbi:MAG: hypothetical protein JMN24_05110 [gamma proteobacterium endosymbiont of Lamellibrachia anaximandri]|nr:hypothetical protein [gamma proteobacterium endosymbiont of Lamellibrachia anaximandri]MBL3618887.1 hypothetical protein [gamma proteobacterium endosymbiont of Lamellibrachia anaximandri]
MIENAFISYVTVAFVIAFWALMIFVFGTTGLFMAISSSALIYVVGRFFND